MICLWVLIGLIFQFLPLEFANKQTKTTYYFICLYGFPTAIFFAFFYTIKRSETIKSIVQKLITILLLSTLSFWTLLFIGLPNMCDWNNRETLYRKKTNPLIIIVKRSHDCGIYDSYEADTTFKTTILLKQFIWATKIDTSSLNQNDWIPVKE